MDEKIYRGYVRLKGKRAAEKFKYPTKLRSLDQVEDCEGYGGVLNKDYVLIDVDDREDAEKLIKIVQDKHINCRISRTTHGAHFIFKNNGVEKQYTNILCALGIPVDIKPGVTNCYQALKVDGVKREVIQYAIDEPDTLPVFLQPTNSRGRRKFKTGERNSSMYADILSLQSQGFSKEEIKTIHNLANKYVLDTPLSDEEMNVIHRDEAFEKPKFYVNGKFQAQMMAKYLINTYNFKILDGELCFFNGKIYESDNREILKIIDRHDETLSSRQMSEVITKMTIKAHTYKRASPKYIAFNNGVLDIYSGELLEHSPKIAITNIIPHDYDTNAYSEVIDTTLNNIACGDKDIKANLEELIGYAMYRSNRLPFFTFLLGDGSNGKSTYIELLKSVIGSDNLSHLSPSQLTGRFNTAMMSGKLANIADDISADYLSSAATNTMKQITSGVELKAERKGKEPFNFKPYIKLIFSANEMPLMDDDSHGLVRRLNPIPFNAVFSRNDPNFDPNISDKLKTEEALTYAVLIGVRGLKRFLQQRGFTNFSSRDELIEDLREGNNPMLEFFEKYTRDELVDKTTKDLYSEYSIFAGQNGYERVSQQVFTRKVCKHFNLKSANTSMLFDGKRIDFRVYSK